MQVQGLTEQGQVSLAEMMAKHEGEPPAKKMRKAKVIKDKDIPAEPVEFTPADEAACIRDQCLQQHVEGNKLLLQLQRYKHAGSLKQELEDYVQDMKQHYHQYDELLKPGSAASPDDFIKLNAEVKASIENCIANMKLGEAMLKATNSKPNAKAKTKSKAKAKAKEVFTE